MLLRFRKEVKEVSFKERGLAVGLISGAKRAIGSPENLGRANQEVIRLLNNAQFGCRRFTTARQYRLMLAAWGDLRQVLEESRPASIVFGQLNQLKSCIQESLRLRPAQTA